VIPLTHRDHAQTLVIVTGHTRDGEPELNWQAVCQPHQTVVVYMGHRSLGRLCTRLIAEGLAADTPAALVENGTLPGQQVIAGTLTSLPPLVERAALQGPALLVVGSVAQLATSTADGSRSQNACSVNTGSTRSPQRSR
jgi:siroheme synthase